MPRRKKPAPVIPLRPPSSGAAHAASLRRLAQQMEAGEVTAVAFGVVYASGEYGYDVMLTEDRTEVERLFIAADGVAHRVRAELWAAVFEDQEGKGTRG